MQNLDISLQSHYSWVAKYMTNSLLKQRVFSPIIEVHSSWIVINSIQGCPKSCRYCFLNAQNQTGVKPTQLLSHEETIDALLKHKYYHPAIPLCFFTHTDPLATQSNRDALIALLRLCKERGIKNIKCFSTKCPVPQDFVHEIAKLIEEGEKIIAYVTFSGLDQTIERGVDHKKLYDSLKLVKEANIPLLHFWRPFLPENSSKEKLLNILDRMMPYASASIIRGLKVAPDMIGYMDFWPAIQERAEMALHAESIWPRNVLDFFKSLPKPYCEHPLFMSNSCAISYVMKCPDIGHFYGKKECVQHSRCPAVQRERCAQFYKGLKVSRKDIEEQLAYANIHEEDILEIDDNHQKVTIQIKKERTLTIEDIVYLRHLLHADIVAARKDNYWRSFSSSDMPCEI